VGDQHQRHHQYPALDVVGGRRFGAHCEEEFAADRNNKSLCHYIGGRESRTARDLHTDF